MRDIKYIGTGAFEDRLFGSNKTWEYPGQVQEVPDPVAARMLRNPVFVEVKTEVVRVDQGTGVLVTGPSGMDNTVNLRRGSVLRGGQPLIRLPDSVAGVTASSGVTVQAVTRRGKRCWEVSYPADSSNKSVYFPIPARVYDGKLHVTFEVEDASEWNGGNWRLGLFTDANLNAGMRYVQTVGAATGWNGVHVLMPLASEWVAVGAGSWSSTMAYCAFQGVRKSNPTRATRIWIYEIVEGEKNSLPSIVLGADDGHGTWYNQGLPILEKYGFSSYLAFIRDTAQAGASSMNLAQWQDAIARGHHAVVHGCKQGKASLRDYFTDYAGYATPYEAILADIRYNIAGMVENGLDPDGRGRRFYVLPQGNHQPSGSAGDDTIAAALAAAGITTCRRAAVENGIVINGGWAGAKRYLPIIGHSWAGAGEAANIAAIVARMQDEINAGRSVILMFHQLAATPAIPEEITPANLETLVAAANDLVRSGAARRGKLTDLADELETYASPVHLGH